MADDHVVVDPLEDRSWWRLGKDGWKAVLKSTFKEFGKDEVSNLSAVVTLRIVLSLVPSMIAAVAIAAQFVSTADIQAFVDSAGDVIPDSSREFVAEQLASILDELRRGSVGAIGVAAGVFAASGAAVALMGALNKAYDTEEQRGFVGQRLGSLVVLLALVLALTGMFVAIVLGPSLLELIVPERILDSPLSVLITLGRYLVALGILILFFGFVYWFGPNRDRPRLRLMTPGAVIGVSGWLLLSYLFSIYTRVSGSYSATYGVFAGIIVLLIWLNYSFQVLLMGAELDHEIELYLRAQAQQDLAGARRLPPEAGPTDLDAVESDMPRHPGLVAAAKASGDHEDPPATTGPVPPRQVLLGAASKTPGAGVAAALWTRLRK